MTPIRPENKYLYPTDWKDIRTAILARALSNCEFCGLANYSIVQRGEKEVKVILTIAHLDHDPRNNDHGNLKALCQKCHNTYDAPFRTANRKRNRASIGVEAEGK